MMTSEILKNIVNGVVYPEAKCPNVLAAMPKRMQEELFADIEKVNVVAGLETIEKGSAGRRVVTLKYNDFNISIITANRFEIRQIP